ncbi:AmmeMemoRadiSam system protein A [Halorhabdus sp. CBA1104]|uniref:AmmeMemoRadiSam system protein A n=1 Tax=Halorhabdus sp. CBA1104 TaxID=1380432 RepID=UPI0012B2E84F|nr:AmmeMemoRadiSam system protein A [Halorhabdus sp. CBA1104]QGN07080.1 AmmeMemoRadiSam system protein A [Halorhabdus sp. CBA1104]
MSPGDAARLDSGTGQRLVEHARAVVTAAATDGSAPAAPDLDVLDEERGVFVTLQLDGQLRGCIGRPRPAQPLSDGLQAAAVGASSDDPRFPPLSADELDAVTVSVSVLTPPVTVSGEVPSSIEIGRDGLIVSKGRQTGLLLPQVAVEQEWSTQQFLAQTARKAGLPEAAWREAETTVKRFSAQVFAEESPNGPVTVDEYTRSAGQSAAGERSTD